MSGTDHYSMDLAPDEEGWWPGRCKCGWDGGMYPSADDAADALMDHAYTEGAADTADAARGAVDE
jgi:hypothetical protein